MKILYIHQHFCIPDGTSGTRSYENAKKLISNGHDVTVLCGQSENLATGIEQNNFKFGIRTGQFDSINIIQVKSSYSNKLGALKRIISFLYFSLVSIYYSLRLKYDVMYATSTPLTVAIPGILLKMLRLKKFTFILEIRDLWPEFVEATGFIKNKYLIKLIGILEKLAYKYADYGVALSPGMHDGIMRFGTLNKSNTIMIPNGCDTEFFNVTPKNICDVLSDYASREVISNLKDKKIAVYAGTHGLANNLSYVLKAAKYLNETNKNIAFVFIGDGAEKEKLIQLNNRMQLSNCFFIKPIPKNKLRNVFASSDVGIMSLLDLQSFYYSTSPNKFFDYMASGLPVVCNTPGWVADIISENSCGFLADPNEPRIYADMINRVLQQGDRKTNSLARNTKNVAMSFSRSKLTDRLAHFIESTQNSV